MSGNEVEYAVGGAIRFWGWGWHSTDLGLGSTVTGGYDGHMTGERRI